MILADTKSGPARPETEQVEVYSRAVNAWVVRTPGRQFPALVVQGDSFHQLFALAHDICEHAQRVTEPELRETAEELRDILWTRLLHYEEALHAAGFTLPYSRVAWRPKD